MRAMIRRMVAGPGDEVQECADGAEALAAYEAFQPDWTTMDLRMRHVDGLAATRQIKARFPEARILMLTQHGNEALRVAAQEAGACAYILKENLVNLRQMMASDRKELR